MQYRYHTAAFLALCLFFQGFTSAQGQSSDLLRQGHSAYNGENHPAAIRLSKEVILRLSNPDDSLQMSQLIDACDLAGRAYEKLAEFDSAEVYRKKALELTIGLYSEESLETVEYLNNFAGFYAGRSCAQSAFNMRFRALGLLEKRRDTSNAAACLATAKVCNNLAALFEGKGEMELAVQYQEKALANLNAGADSSTHCILLVHYAHLLARIGLRQEAGVQLDQAAAFLTKMPRPQAYFWNAWAELYRQSNRPDSALFYHYKRLQSLHRYPLGPTDIAHTHLDIGRDFMQLRQWDSCMAHLDTAIRIETGIFGEQFSLNAIAWRMKGQCARNLGDTTRARQYFLKALFANNYDACSITDMREPAEGFQSFYALAELCAESGNDVKALEYYIKADSALHCHRLRLQESGSKIRLSADSRFVYEKAIETAYRLLHTTSAPVYTELAFYLTERHKGLLLQEAFLASNARTLGGIKDSLYEPVLQLRQDLAALQQTRWATADRLLQQRITQWPETHPAVMAISEKIVNCKFRINALEKRLEAANDQYQYLKSDYSPVSWRALRDSILLPAGKSLIQYFVAESGIFIFFVSRQGLSMHYKPAPKDSLQRWVSHMRRGILGSDDEQHPNPGAQPYFDQYLEYGQRLHDLLLPTPMVASLNNTAAWVIIPDDCLSQIPFEALLTRPCQKTQLFKNLPYLVKQRDISYAASATTLRLMTQTKRKADWPVDFSGFAPFYEQPESEMNRIFPGNRFMGAPFDRLDQSGQPLAAGRVVFPSNEVFLYAAATKRQLLEAAPRCRVLEIVTHAVADTAGGSRACLILRKKAGNALVNDSLFSGEIYSLDLKADLALILGCGTGLGKIQAGEGSISLAHAFAGAGAKSVIATQWSVMEAPAARITTDFFKEMQQGKRTDAALASAKRKYLDTAENPDCLPYFWAGFYLFGDANNPVSSK